MSDKYGTEGKTPTGKCKVCTINLWAPDNKPKVWPCGIQAKVIAGKSTEQCPYETTEEQAKIAYEIPLSLTGNGLAQIDQVRK